MVSLHFSFRSLIMLEHNTPLNEDFWSRTSTSSLSKSISTSLYAPENLNTIFPVNTMFLKEVLASAKYNLKKKRVVEAVFLVFFPIATMTELG